MPPRDGETEAQRGGGTCPKSHSKLEAELRLDPELPHCPRASRPGGRCFPTFSAFWTGGASLNVPVPWGTGHHRWPALHAQ